MKTERTNFNKDCKLHLACLDDELRPIFNNIIFQNGYAYASDTHLAVKVLIAHIYPFGGGELLEGKLLSGAFYKEILKHHYIIIEEDGIKCKTSNGDVKYLFTPLADMKIPNFDKMINEYVNAPEGNGAIRFSPNSMDKLAKAMGVNSSEAINVTKKDGGYMIVDPIKTHPIDVIGLIAPYDNK